MENKLYDVFDKIHAEDALKEKTAEFLHKQIQKQGGSRKASPMHHMRFAIVCVSSLLFLLAGGLSYNLYFSPSAYVDMDVNPSIELTLNRFDRVIEANPYNDDGAGILQEVNVRHKTYEEAVQMLLATMIDQEYMTQDGAVSLTVQAGDNNAEKELLEGLLATVSASLASHHLSAAADIFAVSQEVKDCAHEYNLTPAKYIAITQLQEVDSTATFEGCGEHSISEIRQLIEGHGLEHHGDPLSDDGSESKQSLEDGNEIDEDGYEIGENDACDPKHSGNNEHGNGHH